MAEIKSINHSTDVRKIVSVVARRRDGKVLLLRRADTRHEHPGEWGFVTGYIEEGEGASQAAETAKPSSSCCKTRLICSSILRINSDKETFRSF